MRQPTLDPSLTGTFLKARCKVVRPFRLHLQLRGQFRNLTGFPIKPNGILSQGNTIYSCFQQVIINILNMVSILIDSILIGKQKHFLFTLSLQTYFSNIVGLGRYSFPEKRSPKAVYAKNPFMLIHMLHVP